VYGKIYKNDDNKKLNNKDIYCFHFYFFFIPNIDLQFDFRKDIGYFFVVLYMSCLTFPSAKMGRFLFGN